MYTITAEDLMAAKRKLEGVNEGKTPESNTALNALIESTSKLNPVQNMALGTMLLSLVKENPTDAVANAIATGIVIGFQAGLTRAVDEPVKALVESIGVPAGKA